MKFRKYILMLPVLLSPVISRSQVFEDHKTYTRSYPVKAETSLQISNKYGNIHLLPSENDSVRIEVDIKVVEKSPEKLIKTMSSIDVQFTGNLYYITAQTVFTDYKGTVWADISDKATTYISGANKVEINWTIYAPVGLPLKVANKFGAIYTTNHTGNVEFTVVNGDLKAHSLTGESRLNIEFGNAYISEVNYSRIELNCAEIEINKSGKLDIFSRSSKLYLPVVKDLTLDSKRDKFSVDSLVSVKGETSFSYLKFGVLTGNLNLTTKYGSCDVEKVGEAFGFISLMSSYTDIGLTFKSGQSAWISMTLQKTPVNAPDLLKDFKKTILNEKDESYEYSGVLGQAAGEMSTVKVQASYGSVAIIIKP